MNKVTGTLEHGTPPTRREMEPNRTEPNRDERQALATSTFHMLQRKTYPMSARKANSSQKTLGRHLDNENHKQKTTSVRNAILAPPPSGGKDGVERRPYISRPDLLKPDITLSKQSPFVSSNCPRPTRPKTFRQCPTPALALAYT